jgi:hypothetical protein
MKKLLILSLLAATAFPAAAQDAVCDIDLASTVMILVQAQGIAASGDTQTALTFIEQAQLKLDGFQAACGGAEIADPEPPVGIELTQTHTLEKFQGDLTFSYPEGWAQDEDGGGIVVGTAQDVLDRDFGSEPPAMNPGEAAIYIDLGDNGSYGSDDITDPLSLMETLISQIPSSFGTTTEPVAFTANDRPAALFTASGEVADIMVYAVEVGSEGDEVTFALFILLTAPDELNTYEPTLQAIAESIQFDGA